MKRALAPRALLLLFFALAGCASAASSHRPSEPFDPRPYYSRRALQVLEGQASYYHDSLSGNPTANGETYDPSAFTAAHRSLPFGTVVRVTRLSTGHWVLVRINDRGPFGRKKRILDLSRAAARQLDMLRAGVAQVRLEVLEVGPGKKKKKRRH